MRRLEDGALSARRQKDSPGDGVQQSVIQVSGCWLAFAVTGFAFGERRAADVLSAGRAE